MVVERIFATGYKFAIEMGKYYCKLIINMSLYIDDILSLFSGIDLRKFSNSFK